MSVEIKDLAGLSSPLKKLIEVVSEGVGALSKPYLIRKNADARAYEMETIAKGMKENQADLKNIRFNKGKLSLMSLNNNALKEGPSLENRTQQRIEFQEQKRQRNIENVVQEAVNNLEHESRVSDNPVDENWTSRFFNYAEDISNEEMQGLWGKILAGEIKKPKSYSLRTLDLLRNLSTKEAEVFRKFGSLAIQTGDNVFLFDFKEEKFLKEEYTFKERLLLEELGILTANALELTLGKTTNELKSNIFIIGDTIIMQTKLKKRPTQKFQVLVFTKVGQELLPLVSTHPKIEYVQFLATKLNRQNGLVQYGQIIEKLSGGGVKHSKLKEVPLTALEKQNENKET